MIRESWIVTRSRLAVHGIWILDTTLALIVYLDSLEPGLDLEVKLRADPDEPQSRSRRVGSTKECGIRSYVRYERCTVEQARCATPLMEEYGH